MFTNSAPSCTIVKFRNNLSVDLTGWLVGLLGCHKTVIHDDPCLQFEGREGEEAMPLNDGGRRLLAPSIYFVPRLCKYYDCRYRGTHETLWWSAEL
jgi:hypothetical protein